MDRSGADSVLPFNNGSGTFEIKTTTWGNNYGNFTTTTYINGEQVLQFGGDIDPGYVTSNTWQKTYTYSK